MKSPVLDLCTMMEFHARMNGGAEHALLVMQTAGAKWPHMGHRGDPAALLAIIDKAREYLTREVEKAAT